MKTWLKGGLIGAGIWIILFLVGIGLIFLDIKFLTHCSGDLCKGSSVGGLGYVIFAITAWPLMLFGKEGYLYHPFYIILGVILTVLPYFIVGGLMGYFLRKKEEREEESWIKNKTNKMKSSWWLKGGIIGLAVGIILELFFYLLLFLCFSKSCGKLVFLNPVAYTHKLPFYADSLAGPLINIITSAILFALFGALIGYIIYKIKKVIWKK